MFDVSPGTLALRTSERDRLLSDLPKELSRGGGATDKLAIGVSH